MRLTRRLRATLAALFLALLLHASLGTPARACGFHATIFSGEFATDWANLKKNNAAGMTQMAVQELLRILCFVDPYNSAPDSPFWMHSEGGREHARESAVAILHELGPKSAGLVWEALSNAIRFQNREVERALQNVRAAQGKAASALGDLHAELIKDPNAAERLKVPDEQDQMLARAWQMLVTELDLFEVQRAPGAPAPRGRDNHRSVPADRVPMATEYYGPQEFLVLSQFPNASNARCLDAQRRYALATKEAQQAIQNYNRLMANSNMAASDMVPCDEYLSDLQAVLIRIGREALPVIRKDLQNKNREVVAMAQKLVGVIEAQKEPAPAPFVKDRGKDARRIAEVALACWDLADPGRGSKAPAAALEALKARGLQGLGDLIEILASRSMRLKKEAASALDLLTGEKLGENVAAWRAWYAEALEAEKRKPLPPDLADENLSIGLTPKAKSNPPRLLKLPERPLDAPPPEDEKEPTPEERVKDALMPEGQERKSEAEKSAAREEAKSGGDGGKSRIEDEDADRKRYDP